MMELFSSGDCVLLEYRKKSNRWFTRDQVVDKKAFANEGAFEMNKSK